MGELGFGRFLKKKVFNKKNLSKAGKFAGNLAMKELERRAGREELSEDELEELMSMYGNHATEHGMLMGGDLNGQMLFGAGREEELGFGRFLKKKVFNKKNLSKAGKFAGNLAMKELERRAGREELSEDELMELMSMYGNHAAMNGNGQMLFGASREEEDLGFGKWLKKKVFNKKNLNKAGKFAGNLAMKELERRM